MVTPHRRLPRRVRDSRLVAGVARAARAAAWRGPADRRRRRAVRSGTVRRDTVRLALPPAPDGGRTPDALVLTAPAALALPDLLADGGVAGLHVPALATFLVAVERAPGGTVLDVGAGIGLFALVAAAYGRGAVRALEPVPDLAHVARQSAATSRLPVVVEERQLAGRRGESLDAYVERHDLAPAVVHLGPATAADVLEGAAGTVARHRPWVLWTTATAGDAEQARAAAAALPGYVLHSVLPGAGDDAGVGVHLLTPGDPGPAFWPRVEQWFTALTPIVAPRTEAFRHRRLDDA